MSVADLRARALARATKLHPMYIVLDDEIRDRLQQAQSALGTLLVHREKLRESGDLPPAQQQPDSLADDASPTADIDHMVDATRETVEAIQREAADKGEVLVLQFRRLSPAEYQVKVQAAEREARKEAKKADARPETELFLELLRDSLAEACWVRAEDGNGNEVEMSLNEVTASVFDHTDLQSMREHLVGIHRSGQAVPFLPASSGRPATS